MAAGSGRDGRRCYRCAVHSHDETQHEGSATQAPASTQDGVPLARVSRAPRVLPFLVTGLVLGAVAGIALAAVGGLGGNYTEASTYGYFALLLGALGALLGGVAFAVADKRSHG